MDALLELERKVLRGLDFHREAVLHGCFLDCPYYEACYKKGDATGRQQLYEDAARLIERMSERIAIIEEETKT